MKLERGVPTSATAEASLAEGTRSTLLTTHIVDIGQRCVRQLAALIDARINPLEKRQLDIACEAGFNKLNIITMIKQGKT